MPRAPRSNRLRALQACEVCRTRKNRCSEDRPCTYCLEHDLECTYSRDRRTDRRQTLQSTRPTRAPDRASFSPWPHIVDSPSNDESRSFRQSLPAATTQKQQPGRTTPPLTISENHHTPSPIGTHKDESEVMDTNLHNNNLEFYGSSSVVAFLRHVETLSDSHAPAPCARQPEGSLAARLHNTGFQSASVLSSHNETSAGPDRFYFRVATRFLDAYFSNIHYIQPVFEEEEFLTRCEDLWFNRSGKQQLSFIALYYATLSLGSLVVTLDTPEIAGMDRFTWSRKLYKTALAIVTQLGTTTDLEIVQCLYMLSKIAQHELNPHVAYLYSGQAARAALAIGINRSPAKPDTADPRSSAAASKTWWAVYCLDIQTSFALGRPDSLGPDQYHTQCLPIENSQDSNSVPHALQIVPCMVGLSRIMRKTALELYTRPCNMEEKIRKANALDIELADWLDQVPLHLRPETQSDPDTSLRPRRHAGYMKKQSVTIRLRYLNLRMVIHAGFMIDAKPDDEKTAVLLRKCQCRCISSAEDGIDLIYSTFRSDDFFQTWWYNSTYALFAVSVLLAMVFRQLARTKPALENILAHIDRAVLVLQAMDDCIVARNSIVIIKRALDRAKKVRQPALAAQESSSGQYTLYSGALPSPTSMEQQMQLVDTSTLLPTPTVDTGSLGNNVDNLDWLGSCTFDDSHQALFWTEWAHEISSLGM